MKLALFDHRLHDARRFRCGRQELDTWIRRYAKRSQRDSLTRVFVLTGAGEETPVESPEGKRAILGYFALSMSAMELESLTDRDRAKLPRCPVPAVPMGRLAVAEAMQGRGLGGALLFKAAQRALLAREHVAARLFVVDAIDEQAASFYASFGFSPSPSHPMRLYMSLDRLAEQLPG